MAYLRLNFSTRPAASTNFCLPVKKGWQSEQISTWIVGTVERVSTTWPQAQMIFAGLYSGWMPCFITTSDEVYTTKAGPLQIGGFPSFASTSGLLSVIPAQAGIQSFGRII